MLFDSGYWGGLIDWLEDTVQREGNIAPSDVEALVVTDDFGDVRGALDAVEHRRPRRAPRQRRPRSRVDPVAVAATEDDRWRSPPALTSKTAWSSSVPGLVDDLDERELLRLGSEALGADAARGGLEVLAVPAAVARRGGGEVAVDLRERALERGAGAGELALAGEHAADERGPQDGEDDDEPEHESSMRAARSERRARRGARRPCA